MADLRDLGLSEYESTAYRTLLRTGPTTAKELSNESDVPMGRIYDVLNGLEQRALVRSQTASSPKKYAAVEPDTALDRLLDRKRRELDAKAEQYERIVDELSGDLDAVEPPTDRFWTVAVGPEETADLLVERLAAADERILLVAGMPSPQFDLGSVSQRVVDELEAAMDRGVAVSILLTPDLVSTLPERVVERYGRRLADRDGFAARTCPDVDGTFNLVDDAEVCIEIPNPLDPGAAFAMIDFKDPSFVADVRDAFEEQWTRAEPLSL